MGRAKKRTHTPTHTSKRPTPHPIATRLALLRARYIHAFCFQLNLRTGDHYVDGPVFLKSGVTISGRISDDSPNYTTFILYDGDNNGKTSEDAMLVIDGGVLYLNRRLVVATWLEEGHIHS